MILRGAAAAGAVAVLLTACTSVVGGRGGIASSSSHTQPPAGTPASSSASTPVTLPSDLLRTPATTAIGDPPTADLCAAIGLAALQGLGGGLTPTFDGRQYPPGCSVTLRDGTTPVVTVGVYADRGRPAEQTGRTTRTVVGRTVYVYPFQSSSGSCLREIAAAGVLLNIDASPVGGTKPDRGLECGTSDAMATRVAQVVAGGDVPRLALATPSLSQLDACAVVRKADVTALTAFADAQVSEQGFDVSCEVHRASLFLFFNFVIAAAPHPAGADPVTVAGHQLYAVTTQQSFCSYVSTQGSTPDGHYEQVAAVATASGSAVPADLCDETAQALASYLSAAGLS